MRDYQPHANNPYWLPQTLYRRTLALIRDYDRMVEQHENIPEETKPSGQGSGSGTGDRTGSRGVRSAAISLDIDAIDRARLMVPEEYQDGVWNAVQYGARYPDNADRTTYSRHKSRFIYYTALYKGWIFE